MLRDFRPSDQRGLRRLILEGLRDRWGEAFDESVNPDVNDFVANYLGRGAEIVVIESNGEIIATGILLADDGITGRIVRVSVAAANRRQGLARRVVEELVRRARRRSMSEVRVLTDTPWTSAVELYRACGFTEVRSDGTDTHFVMPLWMFAGPAATCP
jgi:ribosomal protein S18 acetylase RimI-like enzyme